MRFFSNDARESADEQALTDDHPERVQSHPVPVPQQRPPSPWAASPSATPTGTNPWEGPNGAFSGQYPSTLVQQFPWDHLQALRTNQQCCGKR